MFIDRLLVVEGEGSSVGRSGAEAEGRSAAETTEELSEKKK